MPNEQGKPLAAEKAAHERYQSGGAVTAPGAQGPPPDPDTVKGLAEVEDDYAKAQAAAIEKATDKPK